MVISKCVVLTIGAFFLTVRFGVVPRHAIARMRYESTCIVVIGPMGLRCWTLAPIVGPFRLMDEYDVDPVLDLLTSARAIEIDFGIADEPCWFSI